jgi:hypothetical protein
MQEKYVTADVLKSTYKKHPTSIGQQLATVAAIGGEDAPAAHGTNASKRAVAFF